MTLPDLCEPLFLCLCRTNRRARAGETITARELRDALISILSGIRAQAAPDSELRSQFASIEPALILFVDEVVRAADWACARAWRSLPDKVRLAAETDRFFALVDETLADPTDSGAERLAVLHTCISLAFLGRPGFDHARERLGLISLRIAAAAPSRPVPITADLTRRTRRILIPLTAALLGSIGAVVTAQLRAYYRDARQLHDTIRTITSATQPAPPPTPEPAR